MSDAEPRSTQRLLARSILAMVLAAPAAAIAGVPIGCADISSVPPFTQFRYEQIQAIFDRLTIPKDPNSQLCTSCHPGSTGPAGLGLGDGSSYANLVGVPSVEMPSLQRVSPGNPLQSYLFIKLNCDTLPVGTQMPQGGAPLSLAQQAFFFDWIRVGAPLSRLGFEDR